MIDRVSGNGSSHEPAEPGMMGFNLLKPFSGITKKVTRGAIPLP